MSRFAVLKAISLYALALWWGGFTFYAARVVPIGNQVLHSKIRQGAITQTVSGELNPLALASLALMGWYFYQENRGSYYYRWGNWVVMLATTVALIVLRLKLNAMFDPAARDIANERSFYRWHEIYLCIATVRWFAATLLMVKMFTVGFSSDKKPVPL